MRNYSTLTEEELLKRLQPGNEHAFTEIYNRYWDKLLAIGFYYVSDKQAAEDIVHYVMINNHTCAQFESDIDISKIDIPPEVKGKYAMFMRGKAISFFDIQERRFVSSTVAMLSHIMAEQASPEIQTSNEPPDLPENISMSMMNDALIEVSPTP